MDTHGPSFQKLKSIFHRDVDLRNIKVQINITGIKGDKVIGYFYLSKDKCTIMAPFSDTVAKIHNFLP